MTFDMECGDDIVAVTITQEDIILICRDIQPGGYWYVAIF